MAKCARGSNGMDHVQRTRPQTDVERHWQRVGGRHELYEINYSGRPG
ncbi:hypothetical protein ACVXG8_09425 [Escherichia coli]